MVVTSSDLKNHMAKYIKLAEKEDIIVTRNGKYVARLTGISKSETPLTDSLVGIIKHEEDIDLNSERNERLAKK